MEEPAPPPAFGFPGRRAPRLLLGPHGTGPPPLTTSGAADPLGPDDSHRTVAVPQRNTPRPPALQHAHSPVRPAAGRTCGDGARPLAPGTRYLAGGWWRRQGASNSLWGQENRRSSPCALWGWGQRLGTPEAGFGVLLSSPCDVTCSPVRHWASGGARSSPLGSSTYGLAVRDFVWECDIFLRETPSASSEPVITSLCQRYLARGAPQSFLFPKGHFLPTPRPSGSGPLSRSPVLAHSCASRRSSNTPPVPGGISDSYI